MNNANVAITGIGAVNAAAADAASFEEALRSPERVFVPSARHELSIEVTVGEAPEERFADHDHGELDNPTGRLCLTAARECAAMVADAGAFDGLVLGTSTGGQSMNESTVFSLLEGVDPGKFNYRRQGCMAAPTRLVARDLDIVGPVQTISTACTSSANAIAMAAAWVRSGKCKRVLAGGGDALCKTTICSFKALDLTGPDMCTPFGEDRPGLTLGEGAGFLALEPLDEVLASGREPLAVLAGFGMSSDAHHMTAPPEDGFGARAAMELALADAGFAAKDVTHINAHGTGTRLNDAAEAVAIAGLFPASLPVTSCKGLIGHTLGGAGGIEAVVSVLSVRSRTAFENLGASTPAQECPVTLVGPGGVELSEAPVVMSNSFAFGGNNCSLIFSGVPR